MAKNWVLVGLILAFAMAMAGCSDMESLRSYERSTDRAGDIFTFNVPEGTQQLRIVFSTQGPPASDGEAFLIIEMDESGNENDGEEIYFGGLGHGKSDEQLIQDPSPGHYEAILSFQGYTGPASVDIGIPSGSTSVGPRGVNLGNDLWGPMGVVITLSVATGGWILYRRHSKRLDREMVRIDETFRELQTNVTGCKSRLLEMQEEFRRQLVKSRLKEAHFLILEKRIDRYLQDLKELDTGSKEIPLEWEP